MNPEMPIKKIYFDCMRCNACCGGQPGYVWLSKKDLMALSEYFGLSIQEFALAFCRMVDIGIEITLSLKEKQNYDCIFLENYGCSVYPVRPVQCKTYPFWETILENEQSWIEEAKYCPGIGKGPLISSNTILDAFLERRQNTPLSIDEITALRALENKWDNQ